MVGAVGVHRLHLGGGADRHLLARQGGGVELQDARHRLQGQALLELLEHLERVLGAQAEVAAPDLLVALEDIEAALDPLGGSLGRDALAVEQVEQGVGRLERGLGVGGGHLAHLVEVGGPVARAQAGEDRRQRGRQLDGVLAPLLVATVAGGQLGAQLLGPLDLGLHLAQLALEDVELGRQLGGLGVLGGAGGGLGDDVNIGPGERLVGRVVEVRQLLGDLDAALPAGGGDLLDLLQVARDPLGVALGQQTRQLARDLDPQLVLEVGDLLDHAQVGLALVLGDRDQHLAGDVHAHVADGGAEGHRAPGPAARTGSR